MPDIQLAVTDEDIMDSYAVMSQLRTHVTEAEYLQRVRKLQDRGYHLVVLRHGGRVVAAAGFKLTASLAWGDFVYIDDLVTDDTYRSCGAGRKLMAWVTDYARERGCTQLHLDSGVHRFGAHRFYLRERMDLTCHHFGMSIVPQE